MVYAMKQRPGAGRRGSLALSALATCLCCACAPQDEFVVNIPENESQASPAEEGQADPADAVPGRPAGPESRDNATVATPRRNTPNLPTYEPVVPEVTAFVGARLWDGSGSRPLEDSILLVRDGKIEQVGPRDSISIPPGTTRLNLEGKTVVPGLINTHGHVGSTRGLDQSPSQYTRENIEAQLGLYARYGVTTVMSLGGDGEAGRVLRDQQATPLLSRARLFVAGPIVNATDPDSARAQVAEVAEFGADLVKIRVDDFLGRAPKMAPEVYKAVIEEAHERGLEVAVHLFYLADAKAVLEAGGDLIAHSIRDAPVDRELISLLLEHDVCVVPTLTREVSSFVYASRPAFFDDPFFLAAADPAVLEQLLEPERQKRARENPDTAVYEKALAMAQKNLKTLSEAGVTIAFGTDSGPPARFQGFFEHMEAELMADAGLEPRAILQAATGDAARCLGKQGEIGTLEPGRWADFLVLDRNPLWDIRNLRSLESVWVAGRRIEGTVHVSGD